MDYLEGFSIPIKGISIGVREYQFSIDNKFFNYFEDSLISVGNYKVNLFLDKRERMFVLNFEISGVFDSKCDRCLAKINIPSLIDYKVFLKFGIVEKNKKSKEIDDVIFIDEGDFSYNLSNIIHQLIMLSMPLSNTYDCENDPNPKCDFEMLDRLEVEDIEVENEEDTISPIWEKLKKDFNKN